jgi:hypothetical protein
MLLEGLLAGAIAILGTTAIGLEVGYRRRLGNKLELTSGDWRIETYSPSLYQLRGKLEFTNLTPRLDVMVPEIKAEVTLLSSGSIEGITTRNVITPRYPNADPRPDNYWESYIVEPKEPGTIEMLVTLEGENLQDLNAAWIRIYYMTYGRAGRVPRLKHVIVPLKFPNPEDSKRWRPVENADLLPIRTHLLTHLDDPVEIVSRYVKPHAQPGDIVTIGESPVAIMQGRFRDPADLNPGWLATRLCYMFSTTSSLATAGGLQALIEQVGAWRVFFSFLGSIPFKLLPRAVQKSFQVDGMFYRIAGYHANLIDDVTGTIPPYDKFIVLGPEDPKGLCDRIREKTGLEAAVVDVNDLRRVKILASSDGVSEALLARALISNPAGNGNEQTPVVLIRPTDVGQTIGSQKPLAIAEKA